MENKVPSFGNSRAPLRYPKILSLLAAASMVVAFGAQAASAATINVNTLTDEFGPQNSAGTGCSLREALEASNRALKFKNVQSFGGCASADPAGNTIVLMPGAMYKLTLSGKNALDNSMGSLGIYSGVTLMGNAAIVDGSKLDRVFEITSANQNDVFDVTIDGLTIQNGLTAGGGGGVESILPNGKLTIKNCTIQDNADTAGTGGGIEVSSGKLDVMNSVVTRNVSLGGGGISILGGSPVSVVNLDGVVVMGNVTNPVGATQGGGINNGGDLTIKNSTLALNISNGSGGAIASTGSRAKLKIMNSTISSNYAENQGGGIYNNSTVLPVSLDLTNVTFTGNHADTTNNLQLPATTPASVSSFLGQYLPQLASSNGSGNGGGLQNLGGTVNLQNTLFAGNFDDSSAFDSNVDFGCASTSEITSKGNNLVGNSDGCPFTAGAADQLGTSANPVLAKLDVLKFNGAPALNILGQSWMLTHALLASSPALDKGSNSGCANAGSSDQTGNSRVFNTTCDIGAVESQVVPTTAPTALNDVFTTAQDTALIGDVVLNDSPATGVTAALVSIPSHGSLTTTLSPLGTFTYKPNTGYSGTDTFTYKISKNFVDSQPATVTITITPASSQNSGTNTGTGTETQSQEQTSQGTNHAPVAVDDNYTVTANTTLTVAVATGLVKNDTDADSNTLTVNTSSVSKTAPFTGTLTVMADGSLTYAPAKDFTGTESFTYKVNDGTVDSTNAAKVTFTVSSSQNVGQAQQAQTSDDTSSQTQTSGTQQATAADQNTTGTGTTTGAQDTTTTGTTGTGTSTTGTGPSTGTSSTATPTVYTGAEQCQGYSDVGVNDPLCTTQYALAKKLFTTSQFNGTGAFTRAQAVKVMGDAFSATYSFVAGKTYCTKKPFNDVSLSFWGTQMICRAKQLGKVKGYPNRTFHPNSTITAAEFAAILLRNSDQTPASVPGAWYSGLWNYVTTNGLSSNTDPMMPMTRTAALDMLYRFSQKGLLKMK